MQQENKDISVKDAEEQGSTNVEKQEQYISVKVTGEQGRSFPLLYPLHLSLSAPQPLYPSAQKLLSKKL